MGDKTKLQPVYRAIRHTKEGLITPTQLGERVDGVGVMVECEWIFRTLLCNGMIGWTTLRYVYKSTVRFCYQKMRAHVGHAQEPKTNCRLTTFYSTQGEIPLPPIMAEKALNLLNIVPQLGNSYSVLYIGLEFVHFQLMDCNVSIFNYGCKLHLITDYYLQIEPLYSDRCNGTEGYDI